MMTTFDPHPPIATPEQIRNHVRAPVMAAESLRLQALNDYQVLDTPREPAFDDITRIAAMICDAPIALISLVDSERQWFKSTVGVEARETPIDSSVCAHAILQHEVLVVRDTQADPRFIGNPLVTGDLHMRFYAGAALKTADGLPLGTVCVLDREPRDLNPDQIEALQALARQTMTQLELRRMLLMAQQSNRYRSRLMAIAGHDLRTPLRAASYAIEKVRRGVDEPSARLLKLAQDSLAEIGQEFDELASMSGTEDALASPDLSAMPIATILDPVMATWRRQAKLKGLRLRLVRSSAWVHSNRALLATLIGNLVGNAVKYTEQGSVLVGCRRRDEQLVIEVIDTGRGMDPATADGLYGAFHQTDPRSEGLGLGLWIVRRTAETLGCTIRVQSRPGQGSRFEVTVPRAIAAETPRA